MSVGNSVGSIKDFRGDGTLFCVIYCGIRYCRYHTKLDESNLYGTGILQD